MCLRCGAEERLGVWLSRTEVLVFDRIKRAGPDGAPWQDIAGMIGSFHNRACNVGTIRVHVYNIREQLAGTDWTIRGSRGKHSTYRLVRQQQRDYRCKSIKSKSAIRSATAR